MKNYLRENISFWNPWIEKEFTVLGLDIPNNKVTYTYDGENIREGDYKMLNSLAEKTIKDKLSGYENNLDDEGWAICLRDAECVEDIFSHLKQEPDIPEEWIGSKNEWFWLIPANSRKSAIARKTYLGYCETLGEPVEKKNEETGDYGQAVVDGKQKLIKVACIKKDKINTFNNFRQKENWEDAVFVCVYPEHIEIYEISKRDFIEYLRQNPKEIMWSSHTKPEDRNIDDVPYFHWVTIDGFKDFDKV